MTIKDIEDRIEELKKETQQLEEILRNNGYYRTQEEIKKIEGMITIIFGPLFFIFMIIYSYGIPGIITRLSNLAFYISITSFAIWISERIIAPKVLWLQQKIFKPKSC